MRRFSVFLAILAALVFMLGCETNSSETTTTKVVNDEDSTDTDADADESDVEVSDADSDDSGNTEEPDETDTDESGKKQGELYGRCYPNKTCNDGLVCDEENDICIKDPKNDSETPDNDTPEEPEDNDIPETPDETPDETTDTDTPETPDETPVVPEVTENHKISGSVQAGSATEVALYECGKTETIASSNTDANGRFAFNADISSSKTYCVKTGDLASCFKGMSDHTANISEITTAAYLLDKNCEDLRKSEIKVRAYAKIGTGSWLG